MITNEEREFILSEMKTLLNEYDYEYYKNYALNKIIDEWAQQKAPLIEAFKKHSNYVEGKFMIAFPSDITRKIDKNASYKFSRYITDVGRLMVDNLPTEINEQRRKEGCFVLPGKIYNILYNLADIAERCISEETARELNEACPEIHAHTGEKTSRVVNKLCTYLGYNKHPDYNKEFAKYADSLSPVVIKRHTVLSINPLDYLTMSFGNSWASCHTIDKRNKRNMPNSYEGQYSSGTISYMLDSSSMIFYTISADYNGNDYWTQPKINRQMFHWGEDKLIQGRLYPQDNDYNSESVYSQYRNVVQKLVSEMYNFPNLWTISKGTEAASKYIHSEGTHYHDYECYDNCTLSKRKDVPNENNITVGAKPICISCGCRHEIAECIDCCHNYDDCICEECGCVVSEDDAIYIDGAGYYCRDCCIYCECCNEYCIGDSHYIESEDIYVCDDCLSEYYTYCECCEEYVSRDQATYIEDENRYVCDSCLAENYFLCDECNEYCSNCKKNIHGDKYLCDDCYEEATAEETV